MLGKVELSRRTVLAGASALTASGVIGGPALTPSFAKGALSAAQAPAFYRFKVGDIEAAVVSDGQLTVGPANTELFKGISQDNIDKTLADNFLSSANLTLDENTLLLNTGGKLVLFDVGVGGAKTFGANAGRILANLKALGLDGGHIDAIVLTHVHPDHCWGLMTEDGSRNFPNAQIYLAQSDFDFWTDEGKRSIPFIGGFIEPTRKQLLPNRDRMVFYKDGEEILPGVQVMSAPGHTVGHSIFMITSQGKTLCLAADLAHHPLLSLYNPKVEFGFDTDPQQGVASRIKVFDMLVAQRVPLLAYHFPWPGIGNLARQGDGYRFIPVPFQTVL